MSSRITKPAEPNVAPQVALIWTVGLLPALAFMQQWRIALALLAITLLTAAVLVRSQSILRQLGWLILPVTIPLLGIHGILNPAHSAHFYIGGWLPIRPNGFSYACVTSCRLALLAAALIIWRYTKRQDVLVFFQRLGVTTRGLCFLAVAASSIEVFSARTQTVYLAQEARGVNWSGGIKSRFAALLRILVPVVTAAIVEAHQRGLLMENRAFGHTPLLLPKRWLDNWPQPAWRSIILALIPATAAFLFHFIL
jgi:energy-coupling factor transport system permease protein